MEIKQLRVTPNGVDYHSRFDFFVSCFEIPLFLNTGDVGTILLDFYNFITNDHLDGLSVALTGKKHGQNTTRILKNNFDISLPQSITDIMEARRCYSHELVSQKLSERELIERVYVLCKFNPKTKSSGFYELDEFEEFVICEVEKYFSDNLDFYLNHFIEKLKRDGVVFDFENEYSVRISNLIKDLLDISSKSRIALNDEKRKIRENIRNSIFTSIQT